MNILICGQSWCACLFLGRDGGGAVGGPGGEEGSALDPCHSTALPLPDTGEPCFSDSGHSEWSQRTQRAEQGWADPAGTSAWAGRNACPSLASSSRESWANPRRDGLGTRRRKEVARLTGCHPDALAGGVF